MLPTVRQTIVIPSGELICKYGARDTAASPPCCAHKDQVVNKPIVIAASSDVFQVMRVMRNLRCVEQANFGRRSRLARRLME
jgi:hypothetical protein